MSVVTVRPDRTSVGNVVELLRPDHWFKNAFAVPGLLAAIALSPDGHHAGELAWRISVGAASLCLTASANYVLNALLDAKSDAHHPAKRLRVIPSGIVPTPVAWGLYALTTIAGLGSALLLGPRFALSLLVLWVMGLAYNVRPVRTKDVPYLDVLSESANNPIRLLAGWWVVAAGAPMPPGSLILAYWMGGGFLMALKRFGELRYFGDAAVAASYRRSFAHYTETRLLGSVVFYGATALAFLAAFTVRYRLELLLSLPLGAATMAGWFACAFREDSPVQRPEQLWRERGVMLLAAAFAAAVTLLLFVDLPFLDELLSPTIPSLTD